MSSNTWTPTAVASSAAPARIDLWRAVEAQHQVSTMALVETLAEQELLESLLDASKPALPAEAKGLHYLLFTPFRYPPPARGSRFRSVLDPGVFYGAETIRTACAELGYWRWRFLCDSPALEAIDPQMQTVFRAAVAGPTLDLRAPPFDGDRAQWVSASYDATQRLATSAREAGIAIIRYESVRDPERGGCGAVLSARAFAEKQPLAREHWWLAVSRERVVWKRDHGGQPTTFEFDARIFAA